MKAKLTHLFLLIIIFFTALPSATAQGLIYVGYCDSSIATDKSGHISGMSGADSDISLAIRLPKETLSGYVGCKISAVHLGLPTTTDGYPASFTGWVRSAKDEADITSGTKKGLKTGWNNITLAKAYTITGQEEELWVGVTYHQDAKISIISFAGPTNADGAWLGKNSKWSSFASENWGSLSLEAVVEGNVPTHNLCIYDVATKNELMRMGDSFVVTGSIKNLATETAVKPYILCTLNGKEAGRFTIEKSLAYLDATDFSITVPTTVVTEEGPVDCQLIVCWADGSEDQGPDDNVAHLSFSVAKELFYRKMVVEEGTGTWCGWCVYGIVGLREMKKLHPDDFIGIAIHSGDPYEVAGYTSWINKKLPSGFPGCINNRVNKEELPRLAELQAWYAGMPNVADAGVWLTASVSGTKITFETETRFYRNISGTDYRMVFVVTENKIPVTQKNYYTGGARGARGRRAERRWHCARAARTLWRDGQHQDPAADGPAGHLRADLAALLGGHDDAAARARLPHEGLRHPQPLPAERTVPQRHREPVERARPRAGEPRDAVRDRPAARPLGAVRRDEFPCALPDAGRCDQDLSEGAARAARELRSLP